MFLGFLAAAAISGGVTAYVVNSSIEKQAVITSSDFASSGAGSHFTAYQSEKYPDLTYAAENSVKAVVNIENVQEVRQSGRYRSQGGGMDPFFEFFGIPQGQGYDDMPQETRSGGSGVIISSDGYIVTNNHVVENASKLKVTLNDRKTYDAKLIGTDPASDVALIKIEATGLPTLSFGNSDDLRLGEWVLAIGSPYNLRSTVTAGIVSAKARNLDIIPTNYRVESVIQTDAAVNPGNSGGALVNTRGELVGINTVIKSPTGSYTGYSFAIPVSIVRKVVVDLKEYGVVQRAMLGISFREVDDEFVEKEGEKYGIKESGGIYVATVDPDGAAAAAGIKVGDVITDIDGVKIDNSAALLEQIAKHRPNDKVKIIAKRGGAVKQFDVVLRNKAGKTELLTRDYVDAEKELGGTFADVNAQAKKKLDIDGGIQVMSIAEGGILSKANVKRGYIITAINGRAIRTVGDLGKITSKITAIEGVYPDGQKASYSRME